MGQFQPEAAAQFLNFLPAHERADPLTAYRSRLSNPDAAVHLPAAHHWAAYENACATLASPQQLPNDHKTADRFALGIASLEAHYMGNDCFLAPNQLLENMHRIDHLPATIIQGRYDVICPPRTAYTLAQAWRNAKLMIVADGAHSAHEPAMERALVEGVRDMIARVG
jgi:proline iminopeptidase